MAHAEELVARILSGEKELFEEIVKQYQGLLYSIAYSILRDEMEAENVAQEAFIHAYLSLDRYEGRGFKTWICRIATNKAIDVKRKWTRRLQHTTEFPESGNEPSGGEFEEDVELHDEYQKLLAVIDSLPERYARVVRLRHMEGCSVAQIADMTGQAQKTVESQLYRAKQMIKRKWGENCDEALRQGAMAAIHR